MTASLAAKWWPHAPHGQLCLLSLFLGAASTLLISSLIPLGSLLLGVLFAFLLAWRYQIFVLLACYLLGFSNAVWQFSQHKSQSLPSHYEQVDLKVSGMVSDLTSIRRGDVKFRLLVDDFEQTELAHLSGAQLQLSCYRCPWQIKAGQHWRFTIRLKRPYGFASPGAFDYEKYLFRHQIVARGSVRTKELAELDEKQLFNANSLRERIRTDLERQLKNRPIREDVGISLIMALAIGDKSLISNDQNKVLQKTGVSHLIAISGLHIGLIFAAVFALSNLLLRPFTCLYQNVARQQLALFPALASAIFYAALAGFAVSTQRALIMLLIFSLSRLLARPLSLLQVLLTTAVVVVLIDPFSVLDQGFWLSFGAVLVIAFCLRDNDNKLKLLRLQPLLWLGMTPLVALLFGQVSLVSPVVNLVLVPLFCLVLIPLTLFSIVILQLGLTVSASFLLTQLATIYSLGFELLDAIAGHNMAVFYVSELGFWQLFMTAFTIVVFILRWRLRKFVLIPCLISIFIPQTTGVDDELKLSLLDVGQGLSMVITLADYTLVYDVGPRYRSGFNTADAVLLPYLRSRGIHQLDTLIISHADNDHIGGYEALDAAMPASLVYSSRQDKLPNSKACRAGMKWRISDTEFEFLSPQKETPKGSNNWSCVLMITHAGQRVLITGDIEKQVERFLLETNRHLSADLLLVPHQGSKTSSTSEFIKAVNPSLALVAAGYRNHYGHPHANVMQRYKNADIEVLSTIEHGTIEVNLTQQGMRWESYRLESQHLWH